MREDFGHCFPPDHCTIASLCVLHIIPPVIQLDIPEVLYIHYKYQYIISGFGDIKSYMNFHNTDSVVRSDGGSVGRELYLPTDPFVIRPYARHFTPLSLMG